jgi:hypothetical protein
MTYIACSYVFYHYSIVFDPSYNLLKIFMDLGIYRTIYIVLLVCLYWTTCLFFTIKSLFKMQSLMMLESHSQDVRCEADIITYVITSDVFVCKSFRSRHDATNTFQQVTGRPDSPHFRHQR